MPDHSDAPRLTEPSIVGCLFATGFAVEVSEHFVRLVCWVDLPVVGYGDEAERRIIARLVMPPATARELSRALRKGLSRGGH